MHAHAPRCEISCALRARSDPLRVGWDNFLPNHGKIETLKLDIVRRFRNKDPDETLIEGLQDIINTKLHDKFRAGGHTVCGCVPPRFAIGLHLPST